LKDRTLTLQSPKLSAAEFEQVLAPFFDRDLLLPREDEYRVSCSIFAPLEDAMLRGRIDSTEIDLCLLAGGSCLIPQVADVVGDYFSNARVLSFPTRDDTQTAIAKGAALHALSLALTGKAVFQPVCHDDICFQTSRGPVVLVPRGAELPYPPGGGFRRKDDFKAPRPVEAGTEGEIRIQIVAGDEQRTLFEEIWQITGPVKRGAPLWLDFRFNENQILDLAMGKAGDDSQFERTVQNPLTHVVNPNATKARIEDLEEKLRTRNVTREEMPAQFDELANLYRKLRQYEKALAYYGRELQLLANPPAYLLNRMAFCARDLGDRERAERFFLEADRLEPWSGTWFNWALAKEQWGRPAEALDLVQKAIAMEDDPAYSSLKARLVQKTGDPEGGIRIARDALKRFSPPAAQDDYQLSWFRLAARIAGENSVWQEADAMARKRATHTEWRSQVGGELPDMARSSGEDDL
jgi:hypothetical protein